MGHVDRHGHSGPCCVSMLCVWLRHSITNGEHLRERWFLVWKMCANSQLLFLSCYIWTSHPLLQARAVTRRKYVTSNFWLTNKSPRTSVRFHISVHQLYSFFMPLGLFFTNKNIVGPKWQQDHQHIEFQSVNDPVALPLQERAKGFQYGKD